MKIRPRLAPLTVGTVVVAVATALSAAPAMGATVEAPHAQVIASGASRPQTVDPAGTYEMYSGSGLIGTETIKADHSYSYELESGASGTGYWVLEGKYYAEVVAASANDSADIGCLFLGKVVPGVGISSESAPGPFDCNGSSGTWYATLESGGSVLNFPGNSSLALTSGRVYAKAASPSSPSGNYKLHLSDGAKGALTIVTGGTFSLNYGSGDTDSGYWVSLGKSYAQVTTSSTSTEDLGCTLLGEVSPTTGDIGSASAQGPFVCGETGQTGTWYATKKA
jgi:hypothetical protein